MDAVDNIIMAARKSGASFSRTRNDLFSKAIDTMCHVYKLCRVYSAIFKSQATGKLVGKWNICDFNDALFRAPAPEPTPSNLDDTLRSIFVLMGPLLCVWFTRFFVFFYILWASEISSLTFQGNSVEFFRWKMRTESEKRAGFRTLLLRFFRWHNLSCRFYEF